MKWLSAAGKTRGARLTPRAWGVLGTSIALLALGQGLGYPVLQVLAGAGLAAVIISFLTLPRRPRVSVDRVLYPDRVECDQPALARLMVRNESGRRQPSFVATDSAGTHEAQVLVDSLAPGGTATYHYELPTSRRGPLPVGPLTLSSTDALGLVSSRVTIGSPTTLLVHPRRYAAGPATGIRRRHHFEGPVSAGPLRGSIDLRRLREYVRGDDSRYVHWKASARTGQLMVREYADPDQPRLRLLLDTRASALDPDQFEAAISVAASIMVASAQAGHRLRLNTTSGTDHEVESVSDLLDELAMLQQVPGKADSFRPGRDGGALVVLSGGEEVAALAATPDLQSAHWPVVCFDLAADEQETRTVQGVYLIQAGTAQAAIDSWTSLSTGGTA